LLHSLLNLQNHQTSIVSVPENLGNTWLPLRMVDQCRALLDFWDVACPSGGEHSFWPPVPTKERFNYMLFPSKCSNSGATSQTISNSDFKIVEDLLVKPMFFAALFGTVSSMVLCCRPDVKRTGPRGATGAERVLGETHGAEG
jgi:hypothetical protein